jgi:predicted secreted hydrolase
MRRLFVVLVLAGLAAAGVLVLARPQPSVSPPLRLAGNGPASLAGFSRALEPKEFTFPLDHGPHLDFQTEWWYYTGNLTTPDGARVGYQLTFFRRALAPGATERPSGLATNQVYFAHFALTDVAANEHRAAERFSRGAAGLAGATGQPFAVWLEDWRAEALDETGETVRLVAHEGDLSLDLTLSAEKPVVRHGDQGLSPKSGEPGNASYYLSYTRMRTTGTVELAGNAAAVEGLSWFDHEWSTSALGQEAIGWDWFSLQLDDGRELMYFQIRREDGSLEPVSGGTLIELDGSTRRVSADEMELEVLELWRSPATGGEYPARWRMRLPREGLELDIRPLVADQEMDVSFVYWEGAVRLAGTAGGQPVGGYGYIELTGYVTSIAGQF